MASPPCDQHREGTDASEACNQAEKRRGEAAQEPLLPGQRKLESGGGRLCLGPTDSRGQCGPPTAGLVGPLDHPTS